VTWLPFFWGWFWLAIAELGLALNPTWRKTRYLFVLCQAPFCFWQPMGWLVWRAGSDAR
jgi:hypothetical protein